MFVFVGSALGKPSVFAICTFCTYTCFSESIIYISAVHGRARIKTTKKCEMQQNRSTGMNSRKRDRYCLETLIPTSVMEHSAILCYSNRSNRNDSAWQSILRSFTSESFYQLLNGCYGFCILKWGFAWVLKVLFFNVPSLKNILDNL